MLFKEAESAGLSSLEVRAGALHRRIGGYPGPSHQMPICCHAMRDEALESDRIIQSPPKGAGASLTIRYQLRRPTRCKMAPPSRAEARHNSMRCRRGVSGPQSRVPTWGLEQGALVSKQTFDAETREAIWTAYARKCVYTGVLLDPHSMQIDHVVRESLLDDPLALQQLRVTLGLPPNFDILGFENLVACHTPRNLQKGAIDFDEASLRFFLNIARAKKPLIEENLEKIRRRLDTGRALVMIQQMLQRGAVDQDAVAKLVTKPAAEVFRLAEAMHFGDSMSIEVIAKADLPSLEQRLVGLGGNTGIDGLPLGNDQGEERTVHTCAEYWAAVEGGFYPRNTFEITIATFFKHQCGLLSALKRAQLPQASFLAEPRVGVSDVHLLPFKLFPDPAAMKDDPVPTQTYADMVRSGDLVIRSTASNKLTVEGHGMGQYLVEALRADFDGDGLEEMLVFEYGFATGGTFRFGGILILGRKSVDGLLEVVATND